jgi:hypothetical protein
MARQRIKAPHAPWLIPFVVTTTLVLALAGVVFGATSLRPRQIECITSENTYCRTDILDSLKDLKNTRFLLAGKALREKEKELTQSYPDLAAVQLRRTFTGTIHAQITLAQPLLILDLNGQATLIRENGYLAPAESQEGRLEIELIATTSGQQLTEPWGESEQRNLAHLADAFEHFRPRIKKLRASEPTKITAFPEGNGPIYLRVDDEADIEKQLSTLQAFFRSTTMETPYQELDVRFSNLVIKE